MKADARQSSDRTGDRIMPDEAERIAIGSSSFIPRGCPGKMRRHGLGQEAGRAADGRRHSVGSASHGTHRRNDGGSHGRKHHVDGAG
jgi:hypothetical protein